MDQKYSVAKVLDSSDGLLHQHNFRNRYLEATDLVKPCHAQAKALTKYTQDKLNDLAMVRTENSQRSFADKNKHQSEASYIKYTPKQQNIQNCSGAKARIIKMQTAQVDPLAPPQFRHKRIAQPQRSPPPQVMHSPPRKITVKDQQDWKIPPCISNWKNPYGYTIPLDMRLSADGRNLQKVTINDKFSQFTNAMYLAEKQARSEIEERIKIQKSQRYKEYLKQEEEMREAALKARQEKKRLLESAVENLPSGENLNRQDRDDIRQLRKREIERERRIEQQLKTRQAKHSDRDITERVALGQAQPDKQSNELLYDQRLFNQSQGLDHGYTHDDDYNLYDKPLFQDKTALKIYNQQQQFQEDGGAEEKKGRNAPLEFERGQDELFGMEEFVEDQAKKRQKQ